jgi:hypothetical protein
MILIDTTECKGLVFDGAVTREAIRKLRKYLELTEGDYPSKDELEQQPSSNPSSSPPSYLNYLRFTAATVRVGAYVTGVKNTLALFFCSDVVGLFGKAGRRQREYQAL